MINTLQRMLESRSLTIVSWIIATAFACAAIISWFLLVPYLPYVAKILGSYRVHFHANNEFFVILSVTIVFAVPPALRIWVTLRNTSPSVSKILLWGSGIFVLIIMLVTTTLPVFCHSATQTGDYYHCGTWREYWGHQNE